MKREKLRDREIPAEKKRAWDEHMVAEAYGVTVGTLRNWRCQGRGPKYFKVGSRVLYRPGDLDPFFFGHPVLTSDSQE